MDATETWHIQHQFLIADVIQFVSGTMITFSQRGAAKIKSNQFSEFGSRTNTLASPNDCRSTENLVQILQGLS